MSRSTRRCLVLTFDGRSLNLGDDADFFAIDRDERPYERREDVGMSGVLEVLLHWRGRWFAGKAVGSRFHHGDGTFTNRLEYFDGTHGYLPPGYNSFDEVSTADVRDWFKARFGYFPAVVVDLLAESPADVATEAKVEPTMEAADEVEPAVGKQRGGRKVDPAVLETGVAWMTWGYSETYHLAKHIGVEPSVTGNRVKTWGQWRRSHPAEAAKLLDSFGATVKAIRAKPDRLAGSFLMWAESHPTEAASILRDSSLVVVKPSEPGETRGKAKQAERKTAKK